MICVSHVRWVDLLTLSIVALKLGQGEYSRVKQGRHKDTDIPVAVKLIKKSKLQAEDLASVLQEVDILKELSSYDENQATGFTTTHNPHFVQLFDFYDTPKQYFLVLEMMEGGELFDRIVERTYYSVQDAKECCKNLLEAVQFLHERNICHRDLKPENLLLKDFTSDTKIKIADFGFAKRSTDRMNTQCGTPGYVAPEVSPLLIFLQTYHYIFLMLFMITKILCHDDYGLGVDIWSVGVILYTLLAGYPPFLENDQKDLFVKIKEGNFEFHHTYWCDVPDEPKDLISNMLVVDPTHRFSARDALAHPWFEGEREQDTIELMTSLINLRKFNGKRKLRAAVRAVVITNRMERFADSIARKSI